jgi:hypothetical protein
MREYPFQKEVCDAYLNEVDWTWPIKETPWEEVTLMKRFQDRPQFKRWLKTPASEVWGHKVGRLTASNFRATWRRTV